MKPSLYLRLIPSLAVASTCFSNQNMKPGIYLRSGQLQVPVSLQKYEDQHVTETWPVAGTWFFTQNIKRGCT